MSHSPKFKALAMALGLSLFAGLLTVSSFAAEKTTGDPARYLQGCGERMAAFARRSMRGTRTYTIGKLANG